MTDEDLKKVIATAEKRRAGLRQELSERDLVSIGRDLGISETDMISAAAEVRALASAESVSIEATPEQLVFHSNAIGLRWPLLGRIATALGFISLAVGWASRAWHGSHLMAAGAIPIVAAMIWYMGRCIRVAFERVTLRLGHESSLTITSLPLLTSRRVFDVTQVSLDQPEMAADEDGGFQIAPMYWLPIRIGGRLFNVSAGHRKGDLVFAYDQISRWLRENKSTKQE